MINIEIIPKKVWGSVKASVSQQNTVSGEIMTQNSSS